MPLPTNTQSTLLIQSFSALEEGLFSGLEVTVGEHFALLLPLLRNPNYTSDTATWNSALTQPISPAPGTSAAGNLEIGPNFWPLTELLSSTNALWVPQISYTDPDYIDANQDAQSILTAIGISNLGAIEIGNEPNLYGGVEAPSATDAQ